MADSTNEAAAVEAAARAIALAESWDGWDTDSDTPNGNTPDGQREWCREMARAAIAAHAAALVGEAVYQIENDPEEWFDVEQAMYEGHDGSRKRVLYTHPTSAPDVAVIRSVIENLNNATAVMRDKRTEAGPNRAWLTEQVNLLRAAIQQETAHAKA